MANPAFKAIGAFTPGGGDVTPPWPTHASGDYAWLICACVGSQTIPSAPSGWTELADSPVAVGGFGDGVTITIFERFAASASETNPTVLDPGNYLACQIVTFSDVNATTPVNASQTSTEAVATTSVSATGVTTTENNCLIVAVVGSPNDAISTSEFSGWTNANLTSITERGDNTTNQNAGGGFGIATGTLASAGASGATTVTMANSNLAAMFVAALAPVAAASSTQGLMALF